MNISDWVRSKYRVVEPLESASGLVEAWDGDILVGAWSEGGLLPPKLYTEFYWAYYAARPRVTRILLRSVGDETSS